MNAIWQMVEGFKGYVYGAVPEVERERPASGFEDQVEKWEKAANAILMSAWATQLYGNQHTFNRARALRLEGTELLGQLLDGKENLEDLILRVHSAVKYLFEREDCLLKYSLALGEEQVCQVESLYMKKRIIPLVEGYRALVQSKMISDDGLVESMHCRFDGHLLISILYKINTTLSRDLIVQIEHAILQLVFYERKCKRDDQLVLPDLYLRSGKMVLGVMSGLFSQQAKDLLWQPPKMPLDPHWHRKLAGTLSLYGLK